ncbi:hypothetical protein [Micromonospora sp. DT47]|uniref:hypothetical protein n=1 Tax=Micromonospora sp. DT47 TaxID=3393431 RepID=UPI003CFA4C8F
MSDPFSSKRGVVAEHPGPAVVVRVEHQGRTYPLRIDWADAGATVVPDNPTTPPAAGLAEMIRRDPSLEDGR